MNIVCDKTLLSAAIDGVSKAVTLRSSIPVLEGILLKAEGFQLTLTGYDLEMGIVTTIEANIKEPGEIVLNAKLLSSMISRMPAGQITIQSADNGKTTIQSGVAQFEIQSMSATSSAICVAWSTIRRCGPTRASSTRRQASARRSISTTSSGTTTAATAG